MVLNVLGEQLPVVLRAGNDDPEYTFNLPVYGTGEEVTVNMRVVSRPDKLPGLPDAIVKIDGPDCRRHRYPDGALCMWHPTDDINHRWVGADGLDALATHIARHLSQEAACRAGDRWPGLEAIRVHDRPTSCTTCGGIGD